MKNHQSHYMLIPNIIGGSVEVFYHFFLGYYLPIINFLSDKFNESDDNTKIKIYVRSCGDLDEWFQLLQSVCTIEIVPPGRMLQQLVTNQGLGISDPIDIVLLEEGDDHSFFNRDLLRKAQSYLFNSVLPTISNKGKSYPSTVVLDRRMGKFSSKNTEVTFMGSATRSIPNLSELRVYSGNDPSIVIIDPSELPIQSYIQLIQNCDLLVGQYGAGLTNMFFMKPGSEILEITPLVDCGGPKDCYKLLAAALGLRFRRLDQESPFSKIDLQVLFNHISKPRLFELLPYEQNSLRPKKTTFYSILQENRDLKLHLERKTSSKFMISVKALLLKIQNFFIS
jgi:hypothetical protein